MADWYALIQDSDGRLLSVGTVLANPLPVGTTAIALAGQPDFELVLWDQGTRTFVSRPPPVIRDRIVEMMADPDIVLLTTNVRTRVQAALIKYFDDVRNA